MKGFALELLAWHPERMFGWFRDRKSASAPTPELVERVEKVERRLQSIATDWLEFEEKVQRAVWRNAKRRDPPEPAELPTVPPEQPGRYSVGTAPRATATDPISAGIRARRGLRVMRDPADLKEGP